MSDNNIYIGYTQVLQGHQVLDGQVISNKTASKASDVTFKSLATISQFLRTTPSPRPVLRGMPTIDENALTDHTPSPQWNSSPRTLDVEQKRMEMESQDSALGFSTLTTLTPSPQRDVSRGPFSPSNSNIYTPPLFASCIVDETTREQLSALTAPELIGVGIHAKDDTDDLVFLGWELSTITQKPELVSYLQGTPAYNEKMTEGKTIMTAEAVLTQYTSQP